MEGQLFTKGQEVTPKIKFAGYESVGGSFGGLPQHGKIYRVRQYTHAVSGHWFLTLDGLHPSDSWWQGCFDPVISSDKLAELMKEEMNEVTYG
jgi:hypothetical protein